MKTPLDHLTTQDLTHILKEQYRNLTEGMRNQMPDAEQKIIERCILEIEEQLKKRHSAGKYEVN